MKVGDIVEHQGVLRRVLSQDPETRTCVLQGWDASKIEVADDDAEAVLKATPQTWPYVTCASKSAVIGRLVRLTRSNKPGAPPTELVPMVDWVLVDIHRSGGPIFLRPGLKIRHGEVLVGYFEKGSLIRIPVAKTFGSVAHRKALAEKPEPSGPPTVYDLLLDD